MILAWWCYSVTPLKSIFLSNYKVFGFKSFELLFFISKKRKKKEFKPKVVFKCFVQTHYISYSTICGLFVLSLVLLLFLLERKTSWLLSVFFQWSKQKIGKGKRHFCNNTRIFRLLDLSWEKPLLANVNFPFFFST